MKPVDLYVVMAEVCPLVGAELYGRCSGAYVNIFVPAKNPDAALTRVRETLTEDNYKLSRVERCCPVNLDAWDNPNYMEDIAEEGLSQSDLLRAIAEDEVLYGLFEIWDENDDDDDENDEDNDDFLGNN